MARVLVINPNCSIPCSEGIAASLSPFQFPGGPVFDVTTLEEGPPAILSWRDWHSVADPVCRLVEETPADTYVVACASDPAVDAARTVTSRPVLGIFRSAVSAAIARAERFGVIAIVEASKARHMTALRSMGLEARLAAEIALNVDMSALLDSDAASDRLVQAARALVSEGAGAVILGCTGMAHHRQRIEACCGVPVIDPCQAAAVQALLGLCAGNA